jgi:hypothetical protein
VAVLNDEAGASDRCAGRPTRLIPTSRVLYSIRSRSTARLGFREALHEASGYEIARAPSYTCADASERLLLITGGCR